MDFFRRIGTDRHKFKVEFFLKKLSCSAKLKGNVYATIKRGISFIILGEHKVTMERQVPMADDGTCDFNR